MNKRNLKVIFIVFSLFVLSTCGSSGGGGGGQNSYTLSGTLSGLSDGSIVEISNNQDAPVALSQNGEFLITADSGSNYSLAIISNPVEQLCYITNGTGSDLSADVSDISIVCESVSVAVSCTGSADSDGDGLSDCAEIDIWGTNPWLEDTDGDSYLDNDEVAIFNPTNNNFISNPRIADMATIAVDLTSLPHVEMIYSTSTATSQTIGTSHGVGSTSSISHDWGGENSQQIEIGHTASISNTTTVGVEVELAVDGGTTLSLENALTVGFEAAINETSGSVVNWSASEEQANRVNYEESVSATEETGFDYTNGVLEVTAKVRNSGHIPYDLENLTLTAFFFSPERPFEMEPIGNLLYSGGDFPTTTILSGESPPLNFSADVSLQKYQRLLRDSKNIVIMPATYRLLDADDDSLLLVDEDVSVRTAAITIDYGIHVARQDKYRVAVNNGDGSKSVSLNKVLQDILGLSVSQGPGEWIYGDDSTVSTTPAGLLAVGSYAMDTSTNQYWLMAHNHTTNSGADRITDFYHLLNEAYDLNDIQLSAGDKVTLVYVGDADRDGLSDRLERDYGTNEAVFDTDADTLMDALEIYGWWTDLNPASAPACDTGELVRVYSNPLLADSDADGISDSDEKAQCMNPGFDFIALAGNDQFANVSSAMTLIGDIQGTVPAVASYDWILISGPPVYVDSVATYELSGKEPTFTTPDEVSTLVFELTVTVDGNTMTDLVNVQIQKNTSSAVYVGDPVTGLAPDGTVPYSSFSEAIFNAPGMDLYVMSQTSPYTVQTLEIPDGVSLFGGYNENWVRDVDNNKTQIVSSIVTGNQPAVRVQSATSAAATANAGVWFSGISITADGSAGNAGNDVIAFKINGGTASTPGGNVKISDCSFVASDIAAGDSLDVGSSYALLVNHVNRLDVENCAFISGNAGNGQEGPAGINGAHGDDGVMGGGNGTAPGSGGSGGSEGGDGGAGGAGGGTGSGADGTPGTTGQDSPTGETGGAGGTGGNNSCDAGNHGTAGANGSSGNHGAAGGAFDTTATEAFVPANGVDGTDGTHGAGGGGGGGGHTCALVNGGAGGGGGEGGGGGTGGTGGGGGGASIGLWLNNIVTASIRENTITSGNGGPAGNFGPGGLMGGPGQGAYGENDPLRTRGGDGAYGGYGGPGGDGGAGSGGPSIGVYVTSGSAPVITGNIITSANGGIGGDGSFPNAGDGGHSYAVFDANPGDGALPDISGGNVLNVGTGGAAGTSVYGDDGSSGLTGHTNW